MSEREKPKLSKEEKKSRRREFLIALGSAFDIFAQAPYSTAKKESTSDISPKSIGSVHEHKRVYAQLQNESQIFPNASQDQLDQERATGEGMPENSKK